MLQIVQDKLDAAKMIKVALNHNIEKQVAEEVERRLQAIKDNL